jgi:hypothetical protein
MSKPPTLPELPEYLRRDRALLDFVLTDICRAHLERGMELPVDVVPLLCERYLAYGAALAKAPTKSTSLENDKLNSLDHVLAEDCQTYLEQGTEPPAKWALLLCDRFLAYSKALAEVAVRPRGNPGTNTGRWVAALQGAGWKVEPAVAHIAAETGQQRGTIEKNYKRWRNRSKLDK